MTSTGKLTTRDAAANTGHEPLVSVACKEYNPEANVILSEPVRKLIEKIYSFHTKLTIITPVTISVGRASGKTIFVTMARSLQPSIRPASSISTGIASK